MRKALALFSVLVVAALAALVTTAAGAPSSQIQTQRARQRSVLARVNQIGAEADKVTSEWEGAKFHLGQVETQLHRNEFALHVARRNLHAAQKRIMTRLYQLYVDGQPSAVDVLAGASSLSQVIDRLESAQVLSNQDAEIGRQAVSFQLSVQRRQRLLQHERAKRIRIVNNLAAQKQTIEGELAQQKRLLASIGLTIHKLQEQAAAAARRQRQLAEEQLAAQEAQQRAQEPTQPTPDPGGGSTGGGTTTTTPVTVPTGSGVGHPEAASIALQYLGVPYVWGGASPSGFDCSGLVMYVYAQLGISLPHYTVAQWDATQPISLTDAQPGDLIFFNGLGHVGIYLGNGQMVDAPHTGSVVRVESIYGFGAIDGARRVP